MTLTITAVNDPPVAGNESYTTPAGATLNVSAPGVLSNDTDVEGSTLTPTVVVGPASGTLALNPDGSFTYTPPTDFSGADSFTYRASDGHANSNIALVTIAIVPDITISSFTSDETDLQIQYSLNANVAGPFNIGVYASPDGVALHEPLVVVPGQTAVGPHSLTIAPTFTDLRKDYYLVAMVDPANAIPETSETNNTARFTGRSFVVQEPASGKRIVHVHATDNAEVLSVLAPAGGNLNVTIRQPVSAPVPSGSAGPYYDFTGEGTISDIDADAVALNRVTTVFLWQNPTNRFDVDNDGGIYPIDALLIMNYTNANGSQLLDRPRGTGDPFYDVSGDNVVSELDYEQVMNRLNGGSGDVGAPWRNPVNPLDIDNNGLVNDDDEIAILAHLDTIAGGTIPYSAAAVDEVHLRAHTGNDVGIARTSSPIIPFWQFGGADLDTLKGSSASDFLEGGVGNDVIDGGNGNDLLVAGQGADTLTGGTGNDTLFGDTGEDTLTGGDGNDNLVGGDQNDTLSGGPGNDYIAGGPGIDNLSGGDGDDRLFVGPGDSANGGSGTNTTTNDEAWKPAIVGFGELTTSGVEGDSVTVSAYRHNSLQWNGGQHAVTVTIQLLNGADGPQPFAGGSAEHGLDFGGSPTYTVTIPAGGDGYSNTFTFPLLHDIEIEPDENYWLKIINVQGGGYSPYGFELAQMYITDVYMEIESVNTLFINDDDDNENGVPDLDEAPVDYEGDLRRVDILVPSLNENMMTYEVEVTTTGQIALWMDNQKLQAVPTPPRFRASSLAIGQRGVPEMTLYVEGRAQGQAQITATFLSQSGQPAAQKQQSITVIQGRVNLTIFDGQGSPAVPELIEEDVGAFTVANLNDTDGDGVGGVIDSGDNSVKAFTDAEGKVRGINEVDLMRLVIDRPKGYDPLTAVEVVVTQGWQFVRFWSEPTKETAFPLDPNSHSIQVNFADAPQRIIWVEAIAYSASLRDIFIEARYAGDFDRVKATAVWAEIGPVERTTRDAAAVLAEAPWSSIPADSPIRTLLRDTGGTGVRPPGVRPHAAQNVILEAWKAYPAGIQNEPKVQWDVTRRQDALRRLVSQAGVPTDEHNPKFVDVPVLDFANDDSNDIDEDFDKTGAFLILFSVDAPGPQTFQNGALVKKEGLRQLFEEFVRVSIAGRRPTGPGLQGSRASDKLPWTSHKQIEFANGTWNNTAYNDVKLGHDQTEPPN